MAARLTPNATGAILALAAFALFSTHDAFIKVLAVRYSPVQIVFCIALFSFPLILLMLARDRQRDTLIPRNPGWMVARAVAVATSGLGAFYAFSQVPMAQVYAILFATPLLVTILAIPVLGEKVGRHRWGAVLVGLCGVLIVLRPDQAGLSLGHVAALASSVSNACVAVITRKVGPVERMPVMLLYAMMGNFILMGVALPFVYEPMPGRDAVMMVAVALLGFTAMLCIVGAYRRAEAVVVAPMQYSQIIWAVIFGLLFFSELPGKTTIIGAAVVISSGLYIVVREARASVSVATPVLATPGRTEVAGVLPDHSVEPDCTDNAGRNPLAK